MISIVFLLLNGDVVMLAVIFAAFFACASIINYLQEKNITYIQVWNLSFIYIICSEAVLRSELLQLGEVYGVTAVKITIFANLCINAGYFINNKKSNFKNDTKVNPRGKIFIFFLVLSLIYFLTFIQDAFSSFMQGRLAAMENRESNFQLLKSVIGGIGGALPVIASYFFRFIYKYKSKLIFAIIILLCIIPQILWGTRNALLFSVVAPIILFLIGRRFSLFDYIKIGSIGVFFLVFVNSIKSNRDMVAQETSSKDYAETSLSKQIASFGSDEGVVSGTAKLLEYVDHNGYSYGKASSFVLYFWVPRTFWPDKPQQVSYWLVRETSTTEYSDVHSAAYGFWGELYIDFGYMTFFILLFAGYLMRNLDKIKDYNLKKLNYKSTFYILLFPFFFMAVRSPQTSFISLVFISFTYWVIGEVIKKYYTKSIVK